MFRNSLKAVLDHKLYPLLLGALAGLGFPPLYGTPAIYIALPLIIQHLEKQKSSFRAQIFKTCWLFGFGYCLVTLHWMSFALLIEVEQFFWLLPIAFFGIPALMGLFPGICLFLTHQTNLKNFARCLFLAGCWGGVEYLQGHLLTGLPWNLIGYTWPIATGAQLTAIIGIYGLGVVTIFTASLSTLGSSHFSKVLINFIAFLSVSGAGYFRYASAPPTQYTSTHLRLVQPNIKQTLKWSPLFAKNHLQTLLNLSMQPLSPSNPPSYLVIWPESALNYFVEESAALRSLLASTLPKGGLLLTGGIRRTTLPQTGQTSKIWTSVLVLDHHGTIIEHYDKFHLVPFGEYIPFRNDLPRWITKITPGELDYSPGQGPRTLSAGAYPPFSPLICYEVIFPGRAAPRTYGMPQSQKVSPSKTPEWILTITNDGWFGKSIGPHQHSALARIRSIEEGLPVVRVANTGISAIFDGYGRRLAHLALGTQGIIDHRLPQPLKNMTFYRKWGDYPFYILVFLCISLSLILRRRFRA